MKSSAPLSRSAILLIVAIAALLGTPSLAGARDETTSPSTTSPSTTVPSTTASKAAAGQRLCDITDPLIDDISGLVAIENGYAVINDRGSQEQSSQIHLLNADCAVTTTLSAPQRPTDVEDLARTGDGTYWLADIGDNDSVRDSIVLRAFKPDDTSAIDYVLRYPDGVHNSEAVLITDDRTPVIVTKSQDGVAEIYITTRRLTREPSAPLTLRKAGELELEPTGTPGGARDGNLDEANVLVTGGAVSHDGRRVALRTYTDVYEWRIPAHASARRIAAVIVSNTPDRTPVPGEAQGEAIAYNTDDTRLLTLSEGTGKPLQAWQPVRAASENDEGSGWVVAGMTAAVIAAASVVGIVLLRRRRARRG
jgi:hypothetical protein